MTNAHKDEMERRLRWMEETLDGAYNAVHPEGHRNAGGHCISSGICIIAFCYIEALGKVLLKGKGGNFRRFQEFLKRCMSDFISESEAMDFPPTPGGWTEGDEWLWKVFRCGFVHGYPIDGVAWGRHKSYHKYWFYDRHKRLTLNIDELVRGFHRGIAEFQRLADHDAELRSRFIESIFA
jgi:hypothetical protein